MRRAAVTAVVSVALMSCVDVPATQVSVAISAEPGVVARARTLEIKVYAATSTLAEIRSLRPTPNRTEVGFIEVASFPVDLTTTPFEVTHTLVPLDNDPARIYQVEVTALDAAGSFVQARAISGYSLEQKLTLRLRLYDACIDRGPCDEDFRASCQIDGECRIEIRETCELEGAGPGCSGMDAGLDAGVDGGPPPVCTRDTECDDGVACTDDVCDLTTGRCQNTANPSNCDDGDPCTADRCDVTMGCMAVAVPDADMVSCDDGVYCDGFDYCIGGQCDGRQAEPCPPPLSCNETDRTCEGCSATVACPGDRLGPWSACGGFVGPCGSSGNQQRSVESFSCDLITGICVSDITSESQGCTGPDLTGMTCRAMDVSTGPCSCPGGFATRTTTIYMCESEVCMAMPSTSMVGCTCTGDGGMDAGDTCGDGDEIDCCDGVDDTFDGCADCSDPDCFALVGGTNTTECSAMRPAYCGLMDGGVDVCDDGDEVDCCDGFDDFGDGCTDCDDPDCWPTVGATDATSCWMIQPSFCGFTMDAGMSTCADGDETDCCDGLDDLGDGCTDCFDPDCQIPNMTTCMSMCLMLGDAG